LACDSYTADANGVPDVLEKEVVDRFRIEMECADVLDYVQYTTSHVATFVRGVVGPIADRIAQLAPAWALRMLGWLRRSKLFSRRLAYVLAIAVYVFAKVAFCAATLPKKGLDVFSAWLDKQVAPLVTGPGRFVWSLLSGMLHCALSATTGGMLASGCVTEALWTAFSYFSIAGTAVLKIADVVLGSFVSGGLAAFAGPTMTKLRDFGVVAVSGFEDVVRIEGFENINPVLFTYILTAAVHHPKAVVDFARGFLRFFVGAGAADALTTRFADALRAANAGVARGVGVDFAAFIRGLHNAPLLLAVGVFVIVELANFAQCIFARRMCCFSDRTINDLADAGFGVKRAPAPANWA